MDDQLDLLANGLEFSMSGLMAGLIFGLIGWWMFRQGRRNSNMKVLSVGLALMVYPYFTTGPWMDWGLGFALCGLGYWLW